MLFRVNQGLLVSGDHYEAQKLSKNSHKREPAK